MNVIQARYITHKVKKESSCCPNYRVVQSRFLQDRSDGLEDMDGVDAAGSDSAVYTMKNVSASCGYFIDK